MRAVASSSVTGSEARVNTKEVHQLWKIPGQEMEEVKAHTSF
jgi:hypothetical protein